MDVKDRELLEKSIIKIGKFNRFGSKPGLERVSELLHRLNDPQKDLKVIHVGGTNGKGSVCRYVYSALQESGYKTGLFISPYIEEFTERIEYDGKQISPADLYRITELVIEKADEMVQEGLESPTEFEVLTAIAMYYYKEKGADPVVLEVGLGGRGDSTNIIEKALASCIVSVSFDHMDYLGDSLRQIAWEKAGIIKKGCPVIFFSKEQDVIEEICSKAGSKNAEVINCAEYVPYDLKEDMKGTEFSAEIGHRLYNKIRINMPGEHQVSNALCALQIFEILKTQGYSLTEESIKGGMSSARQPGRIEIVKEDPYIILDGSHNADSVKALKEWAEKFFTEEDEVLIVTGVLKDKEYGLIAEMLSDIGTDFIITEPDNPRKLDAAEYKKAFEEVIDPKKELWVLKDTEKAVEEALNKVFVKENNNKAYKALIFTGSLYMIGVVRGKLMRMITEV
ncbi:MAG: bifunctional folylpolyglutamate synthase/dihydrofolate synthase [Clostridiales bacterium]|nr:bifunctional folylpolyglutamate synthase/dihydrofolate synthase [Clostridiales bacterium]